MPDALGATINTPIGADQLQLWKTADNVTLVSFTSDELQALCPVTGQPDVYTANIYWTPDGATIESKSLKFYLWSYRNIGIGAESLAAKIATELTDVVGTDVSVELTQSVRGGLTLYTKAVGA